MNLVSTTLQQDESHGLHGIAAWPFMEVCYPEGPKLEERRVILPFTDAPIQNNGEVQEPLTN
jgi:hypothetical protein